MDEQGINHLLVGHRPKDKAGRGMDDEQEILLRQHGFFLDTCLRQLVVVTDAHMSVMQNSEDPCLEWRSGIDAYSFLLQTATGLNSAVPGETNILGQFKHAWRTWREQNSAEHVCRLHALMHRLFSDSRQIRRDYLEGIGGSSYGSLARKLLNPDSDSRILFVGTGELALAMLPFFVTYDVAAWNHKPIKRPLAHASQIFPQDEASTAANWASHIVLTTPANENNDRMWAQLSSTSHKGIIHLGRRRAEPGDWSDWSKQACYFDLDDVFDLRNSQSSVRSLQICNARKACEQFARTKSELPGYSQLPRSALA